MDTLLHIVPAIPVLITLYGVIARKRFFFLLGFTLYGFLVVPAEMNSYFSTGELSHLIVAALWMAQIIISFPNKLNYDGTKVFKSFAVKTFLALIIINVIGVFIVKNDPNIPDVCMYYHLLFVIFCCLATFLMLSNRVPIQTENN
ncbi:MAG: hypothetical protein ISR00_07550 [Flavobacteriales bacterium]|nr:hypothetical protein [Flavobacteriales bacterium]MBL6873776.1 hypothetical protein [Flavobacteriales bacterium]